VGRYAWPCQLSYISVERLRFNIFRNGDRPPCWVLDIHIFRFLSVCTIMRLTLHHRTQFREERSDVADISWYCDFQHAVRRHVGLLEIRNFNGRSSKGSPYLSFCQITACKAVQCFVKKAIGFCKKAIGKIMEKWKFWNPVAPKKP